MVAARAARTAPIRRSTRSRTAIATTSSTSPWRRRGYPKRWTGRPRRSPGGSPMRWTWSGCSRWRCSSIATGKVLVNEIAPRPHNSGHWTIDACPASQFELHIRAIAGLPLPPAIRHSDAVMKNLVGPDEAALWPDDPRHARVDPAPLRQGRGAARTQDGARHAAVPERLAARRVRHCRGARSCRSATGGGRSASRRLSARSRSRVCRHDRAWPGHPRLPFGGCT